MKIENYVIEKIVYSGNEVEMHFAIGLNNKENVMIRVSKFQDESIIDKWFNLYESYQLTVSNFKNLPRVNSIETIEGKANTVLSTNPGDSLEQINHLNIAQFEELLDAVRHLHSKGIVHGNISPCNIWISNDGHLTLYGAGEWNLGTKRVTKVDDLEQLKQLFIKFGRSNMEFLENTKFEKIDDFYLWLKGYSEKPGLVEKETQIINVPEEVNDENNNHKKEHVKKKIHKKPFVFALITMIILASIYILVSINVNSEVGTTTTKASTNSNSVVETTTAKDSTFSLGSTSVDVKNIMGKPDKIKQSGKASTWYYGDSFINFISSDQVESWSNYNQTLKVSLGNKKEDAPPFKMGSSKKEVIDAMGTPDKISIGQNLWHYQDSTIQFEDEKVILYSNLSGNLNINKEKQVFFKVPVVTDETTVKDSEGKEEETVPSYEEARASLLSKLTGVDSPSSVGMRFQDIQDYFLTGGSYPEVVCLYTNEYGWSEVRIWQYRELYHNYSLPLTFRVNGNLYGERLSFISETKELVIYGNRNIQERYTLINNKFEQTYPN